jgi:hypothetical protein
MTNFDYVHGLEDVSYRVQSEPPHLDELTKCAKQVLSGHMETVIKTIERNVHLV